jgi:hypothetical protein
LRSANGRASVDFPEDTAWFLQTEKGWFSW